MGRGRPAPGRSRCARNRAATAAAPKRSAACMTATPAQTSVSLLARATTRPSRIAAKVGASPTAPTIADTTRSAGRRAASSSASSPAAISIPWPATPAFRSAKPAGSAIAANLAPSSIAVRASAAPSRPPATASTVKTPGRGRDDLPARPADRTGGPEQHEPLWRRIGGRHLITIETILPRSRNPTSEIRR